METLSSFSWQQGDTSTRSRNWDREPRLTDFDARRIPATDDMAVSPRAGAPVRLDFTPGPGERILRKTKRVALVARRHPLNDELPQMCDPAHTCFQITFQRASVRLNVMDGQNPVMTVNEVGFHDLGEVCSRRGLLRGGDDCDWIAIEPSLMHEILDTGTSRRSNDAGFPFLDAPLPSNLFFAQLKLFTIVSDTRNQLSSRQIERMVINLVRRLIDDASSSWKRRNGPRSHPRPTCLRRRMQIVEEAKASLAREYWSELSLTELARKLHCSAAHLSRVFHAATGFKLVDYRQELRLRNGLFLLERSLSDIGDIAVHLGFASHSHFTTAFSRSFGMSPSQFLRWRARPVLEHQAGSIQSSARV